MSEASESNLLITLDSCSTEIRNWIDGVLEDESTKRFIGFDIQFVVVENEDLKIGTVQFCYEPECLMFQFCHIQPELISDSIYNLLSDKKNTFVGKSVQYKLMRLMLALPVAASPLWVDVRNLAATFYCEPELMSSSTTVEKLALKVLEGDDKDLLVIVRQIAYVQNSNWCIEGDLSFEQVKFASFITFICLRIGMVLMSRLAEEGRLSWALPVTVDDDNPRLDGIDAAEQEGRLTWALPVAECSRAIDELNDGIEGCSGNPSLGLINDGKAAEELTQGFGTLSLSHEE